MRLDPAVATYFTNSTKRRCSSSSNRISLRSSRISAPREPCTVRAFTMRCSPSGVRGPVLAPPCILYDQRLWLADGFHRWHAHKVLGAEAISAEVRDGSRRDALLFSLAANSAHGLQRGATDYRRAYDIACRNGLVDPTDSDGVARLLHCSGRWASDLTERARAAAKAARDAEIIRLKDEGRTHREVAREVGVAPQTVTDVQQRRSSETGQSDPPAWRQKLEELSSEPAQNWSAALRALRCVLRHGSDLRH